MNIADWIPGEDVAGVAGELHPGDSVQPRPGRGGGEHQAVIQYTS